MPINQPPKAHEVKDGATFAAWTRAYLGGPVATIADLKLLNRKSKDFFVEYGTNWETLVQVALWCHGRKRRMARVWGYVDQFRWAYSDGAIDLVPDEEERIKKQIKDALKKEKNPAWRARLRRAVGDYRLEVLDEWKAKQVSAV